MTIIPNPIGKRSIKSSWLWMWSNMKEKGQIDQLLLIKEQGAYDTRVSPGRKERSYFKSTLIFLTLI
jgi:hypothetical protein